MEALTSALTQQKDATTSQLIGNLVLVDIGRIVAVEDNIAVVDTGRCSGGLPVLYKGVELLWIGGVANALINDPSNGLCIVLAPKTPLASAKEGTLNTQASAYSQLKGIPVCAIKQNALSVGFDTAGNFVVTGDDETYSLQATEEGVELNCASFAAALSSEKCSVWITKRNTTLDGEEEYLVWAGTKPFMHVKLSSTEGLTTKWLGQSDITAQQYDDMSTYDDYLWEEKRDLEGNRTTSIKDLRTVTEAADGSVTITQTDGSDTLNTITLSAEGDVSIVNKGGAEVHINVDGSISFVAKDAISITTDDVFEIKGNQGVTIDGDGGETIVKNSQTSLYKIIDKLLQLLNGGTVATAGSPAAHTITSGQFSSVIQELGKLSTQ